MPDEITKHSHLSRDRISVSFSRKYNVAQYESIDLHVGLSSDVKSTEELGEAFERIETSVQEEFEKLCSQIEGNKKRRK